MVPEVVILCVVVGAMTQVTCKLLDAVSVNITGVVT